MEGERKIIGQAVDDLPDTLLIDAIADFLTEQNLVGEFLVWLEKWKELGRVRRPK